MIAADLIDRPAPAAKPEAGNAYGSLRVRRCAGIDPNSGQAVWLCDCAPDLGGCGGTALVRGRNLRDGTTTSCGCYQRRAAAARAAGTSPCPTPGCTRRIGPNNNTTGRCWVCQRKVAEADTCRGCGHRGEGRKCSACRRRQSAKGWACVRALFDTPEIPDGR